MSVHQTGFPAGSLVKHRYFVALRPSAAALRAVDMIQRETAIANRIAHDRLHLTMFVTEDFESEPVDLGPIMCRALDKVRTDAFDVALAKFGPNGGSLVATRAPELRCFQRSVSEALCRNGVGARKGWAFNPHVTLGYDSLPAFAGRSIEPILWRADAFVLIHSLLRLTMHRTLGSWQLIEQPRLL